MSNLRTDNNKRTDLQADITSTELSMIHLILIPNNEHYPQLHLLVSTTLLLHGSVHNWICMYTISLAILQDGEFLVTLRALFIYSQNKPNSFVACLSTAYYEWITQEECVRLDREHMWTGWFNFKLSLSRVCYYPDLYLKDWTPTNRKLLPMYWS